MTKIGKEYNWEMSHRLPFHNGLCKHVHGHSYKLLLTLTGEIDSNGMVIDFYDISKIMDPIINELDHSFIADCNDKSIIEFLKQNDFKYVVIETTTTAENISKYILNEIIDEFKRYENISEVSVRLYETNDAWAESTIKL